LNYKFYYYFDMLVILSLMIPFYSFFKYSNDDTRLRRNCLPIMSIWMVVVTLVMFLQTSFLLVKDMSTVITEGREELIEKRVPDDTNMNTNPIRYG
jgi:hypothetical protein